MVSVCKLCLNEKPLIKRSHLFPNFLYKEIGDEKNRINVISSANPFQKKTVQSGAYEEHILCADCDNNLLSKLERYANNNFYSKSYRTNSENFEQITNTNGINLIRCKNLDYYHFKLFLQSLIWRASISTHPLFENFKLESQDEELLRNSLLNLSPLNEDEFACLLLTHQDHEDVDTDLVFINAKKPKKPSFFINQFIYLFHLDIADVNPSVKELSLNSNNEMAITKLPLGEWTNLRSSIIKGTAGQSSENGHTENNTST